MSLPSIRPGGLAAAMFLTAVVAFYAWTPAAFRAPWLSATPTGYYHELAEGLLGGHLHLPRAPDPRLVALPDPYDPAANAAWRVNDLSYFGGHYYLYHSAVPAVVLFAPVKLLTGRHLGEAAATFIFTAGGLAAALALLLRVRRAAFPRSPALPVAACALALAFAQGYQVVLRAGMINQVPISSAYCFLMLGLLTLWRAGENSRFAGRWLALASLACGLAVASRPNYLFTLPILLLPAALRWHADENHPSRRLAAWLAAALVPVTLVLAAQLAYNHARFDSPLEFGTRYMLGEWDQRRLASLGLGNLAVNAGHYLFSAADYHSTFPFVTAPSWQAVGLLLHAPFLWLLPLLLLAWRASVGPAARMLLVAVAWVAGVNFLVLLLLPSGNPAVVLTSANARYSLDFQPALVLLACLAVLGAAQAWVDRPARKVLAGLAAALALVSAIIGLSLDFQRYPAEAYRPLAQVLSRPAWWWQSLHGLTYGPVGLKLQLPADRIGAYEPLVATGDAQGGELLHVFYEAPGIIRLGLVDNLAVGPVSGPIAVDYAQPHVFEVHLGSLYPPDGHPALAGLSDAAIATLRRRLVVRIDGRIVFEAPAYFRSNSAGRVLIGRTDFLLAYAQEKFTGRILEATRGPLVPPAGLTDHAPAYGTLRLRLEFPPNRTGVTEPLVTTGIPQAGDVLHVTYRADGAVRLGFDHWGKPGLITEWIEHAAAGAHTLDLSTGALYPPEGHAALAALSPDERRALKERVHIVFDGRVVLDEAFATYDSSPYDVVPGRNPIGASSSVYGFTGRILESSRLPFPPATR